MARTIKEIQNTINNSLRKNKPDLSSSSASEWSLWTYIVATAIHTFEFIFDVFKKEIDQAADKIAPGTVRWYYEQCKRYQSDNQLEFNTQTAELSYPEKVRGAGDDPYLIKQVSIKENDSRLVIKVATLNANGDVITLDRTQLFNFRAYIEQIRFAGTRIDVTSNNPDILKYKAKIYFDPKVSPSLVENGLVNSLEKYRDDFKFDSMVYRQQFIETLMNTEGIITVELDSLQAKSAADAGYSEIEFDYELVSGYFNYENSQSEKPYELIPLTINNNVGS